MQFVLFLLQSGKACLGEILYRYITGNQFSPECLIDYLDLSSEHNTLEIANNIEAALHIWRQKYSKKKFSHTKTGKSQWSGPLKVFVDIEKAKMSAQRADSLLKILKLHFPTLPQTALERHKIQYNKVTRIARFVGKCMSIGSSFCSKFSEYTSISQIH